MEFIPLLLSSYAPQITTKNRDPLEGYCHETPQGVETPWIGQIIKFMRKPSIFECTYTPYSIVYSQNTQQFVFLCRHRNL